MHLNGEAYLPGTEASGKTVRIEAPAPGVRLLTLDRPDRLNATSGELIRDLHRALDQAAADDECRVVVLTGAGHGFCAGLDLKERPSRQPGAAQVSPQSQMHVQQAIAALVPKLRNLRQPVIAAVNGPASGGGLALALASDIRIAAASAKFNAAFVRIGLSGCDIGVSWLLPRLIGAGRSHELLLTGRLVDAAEAERIGLVNRVVADGEVLDAALATAAETPAPRPPPSNSAPGATPAFAAPRGVPPADPPLRAANRACAACRLRNRPRSSVVNCAIDTLARLVR